MNLIVKIILKKINHQKWETAIWNAADILKKKKPK